MSPEQQRIAIAQACGWRAETYGPSWCESETKMPDYLNDLNAMHEAEKVLNEAYLWNRYKGWLLTWMTEPIRATAPQRCEAFLKTIGKWVTE